AAGSGRPASVDVDGQAQLHRVVLVLEVEHVVLAEEDVVLDLRASEEAIAEPEIDAVRNRVVDAGAELIGESSLVTHPAGRDRCVAPPVWGRNSRNAAQACPCPAGAAADIGHPFLPDRNVVPDVGHDRERRLMTIYRSERWSPADG